MTIATFVACLLASCFVINVHGHGRLLIPPSRSSMFRYKDTDPMLIPYQDKIPSNTNDMALNCGGLYNQKKNGGKCGICGDPYEAEDKPNEAGGKYAQGIIVRKYNEGELIPTEVDITAEHKGYFEFRLCPWNDIHNPAPIECFNDYLLLFEDGSTKWHLPKAASKANGIHKLKIRLPSGVTCEQCILQWRYRTGNAWGRENGKSGLGLGQQEEFYGCSDIAISNDDDSTTTTAAASSNPTTTTPACQCPPSSTSTWPATTSKATTTTTTAATTTTTATTTTSTTAKSGQNSKEPDCRGKPGGLPIYLNCHQFYICDHGKPYTRSCPPGTVYNKIYRVCDHPYNVPDCRNQGR